MMQIRLNVVKFKYYQIQMLLSAIGPLRFGLIDSAFFVAAFPWWALTI